MLLKGVLEDNGIDPDEVLRSAEAGLSEEASTEYDDDAQEDEEEEGEEEGMAAVASTAEGEAQSPGKAQDELSPYVSIFLCMSFTQLQSTCMHPLNTFVIKIVIYEQSQQPDFADGQSFTQHFAMTRNFP